MTSKKRDRQEIILSELRLRPSARLGELASQFGVSKETIRRDMSELSDRGLVARTYGGALPARLAAEPAIREREGLNIDGRRRMAEVVVDLVKDCRVLMIDTGSTMGYVCERLVQTVRQTGSHELTVITNGIRNLMILGENPSIRAIACPGAYDEHEAAMFGPLAIEFLGRFNAEALLTSASGVGPGKVTDAHSDSAAMKRVMMRQASRLILVVDEPKLNVTQFESVADVGQFDDIVTDTAPDAELATGWQQAGVRVHIA